MAKRCRVCKEKFEPYNSTQPCCSPSCALKYIKTKEGKEFKRKVERKDIRERKTKQKKRSQWLKEAQTEFNKFIRARDEGRPCISCGRTDTEVITEDAWRGGSWDCGHYLSVGSHPELRYNPLNAARQCKSCNGGSGKYVKKNHTVAKSYRVSLVERIGIEKVEWLEGPHEPQKYTIEDLIEIKGYYKEQIKLLGSEE